ncbi:MAG: hypothetical protein H0V17_06985 [Deltaproteobacteria bacterium]|nr:hypothetical protein [Deltaproteobacteria bacterium]
MSYLFITAPPPLEARSIDARAIPIHRVFAMLEAENDHSRALWTQEIVERGKESGLTFDEHWRDASVEAGPLPALFLRETARALERRGVRLGLFLGSRFPINTANRFTGAQQARFTTLEATGEPQVFFDPTTRLQTAMFSDRAVVDACASCHNTHADSPKRDWTQGAIMGATTWIYPDERIDVRRALELLAALRTAIRSAYTAYLDKTRTFAAPPVIGTRWPRDGYAVPAADVFMRELSRRSSDATLCDLLEGM